ncbi:hypothetical protein ACFXGA_05070, partial [Actinosynnema sp. NPDC059335]
MSFELVELPALSRFTVNRQEPLRGDAERLGHLWPKARVISVDARGRTLVADRGSRLVDRPATDFGDGPPGTAVLLGEQDGVAYWAVPLTEDETDVGAGGGPGVGAAAGTLQPHEGGHAAGPPGARAP